jgi:hypothetical protein
MTATLPSDLREVFERSAVAELVTLDADGRPLARSVAPSYHQGEICIDVPRADPVADPHVALLFGGARPVVLVQGTAQEDDVVHVRPERVYAWDRADPGAEPRLYDAHLEEVRSGHNEEPEIEQPAPEAGDAVWDARLDELDTAVLACVGPDGFPFAAQVVVHAGDGVLLLDRVPVGVPLEPGPAVLHCPDRTRVRGDLVAREGGWGVLPHAVQDG